jgi:hypothetical protein
LRILFVPFGADNFAPQAQFSSQKNMANLSSPFQKASRFMAELAANGPKSMFMQLWHLGL